MSDIYLHRRLKTTYWWNKDYRSTPNTVKWKDKKVNLMVTTKSALKKYVKGSDDFFTEIKTQSEKCYNLLQL